MTLEATFHSPSSAADRAELLGTILGTVLVLPMLAAMGYGAWLLIRLVV